jgi:hypothetical protein
MREGRVANPQRRWTNKRGFCLPLQSLGALIVKNPLPHFATGFFTVPALKGIRLRRKLSYTSPDSHREKTLTKWRKAAAIKCNG